MRAIFLSLLKRGWWLVVLALLAVTGLFAWQIRHLGIEFQTQTLLDQKASDFQQFEEKHETATWSENEFAVVCLSGRDWVTQEGIETLRAVVGDLEGSPGVGSTMSVLDIPLLRQNPGEKPNILAMAAGLPYLRTTEEVNWAAAKEELLAHELAAGTLVSKDGKNLNILVYLARAADGDARDSQARWQELVGGLHALRDRWKSRLPEPIKLNGVPVIYSYIMDRVAHDLRVFGIAAAVIFSLALLLVYRRLRFVLLPLVTSVLPVGIMLGVMAMRAKDWSFYASLPGWLQKGADALFPGGNFTVITSNLPLLLFVMALPFTIYLAERYLERRQTNPAEPHLASVGEAAASMWVPCLFSSLTAMSGFGAFMESGIIPVRTFGAMMTVGTLVGLLVVFLFFPALQAPLKPIAPAAKGLERRWDLAGAFARLTLARPLAVVIASALLLVAGLVGAFRITAENKFTSYFWPSSQVYQDIEFIDRNLGGTSPLEIYLTSDKEGYFQTKEGLEAIAAVERFFPGIQETGSVRTLTSLTREMRKSFKKEWFPTFDDTALLKAVQGMAPELFQEIMTADGRTASVQVRMQETAPTLNRRAILDAFNRHIDGLRDKELKGLSVETTGIFVLYASMLETLIQSQKDTLWFVVAAIFLMLLILFRSPVDALLVLLPQALPAVTMLGVMGWFKIPLDLVTVMIAAIALGVGVDSAIQYTMRFRQELAVDGDHRAALIRSHATVGRAIWIATSVIVLGFGVLMASDFFPSVWFGLFTGLAMLMSQFSALITLPAIFLLTRRPKPARTSGSVEKAAA